MEIRCPTSQSLESFDGIIDHHSSLRWEVNAILKPDRVVEWLVAYAQSLTNAMTSRWSGLLSLA